MKANILKEVMYLEAKLIGRLKFSGVNIHGANRTAFWKGCVFTLAPGEIFLMISILMIMKM
jgi:hypothetical protein